MEHDRGEAVPNAAGLCRVPVRRWKRGAWERFDDTVSPETSVRVCWTGGAGELWAWPDDLETLCLGHALLEGGGRSFPRPQCDGALSVADLVRRLPDDAADIRPVPTFAVDLSRASYSGSVEPGSDGAPGNLTPETLLGAMETFMTLPGRCPGLWDDTGCFHRAGMLNGSSGALLHLAEDISRHNCVDRLAGRAYLAGLDPGACVLLLSARLTASLYDRARSAGFCFMVSRSAVTTAAVRRATSEGVTLVGFCRPGEKRFTVFADSEGWLAP